MKPKSNLMSRNGRAVLAVLCVVAVGANNARAAVMTQATSMQGSAQNTATPVSADQLDSLVAPIALYPDPLLAQVLAASTYPLEVMQLQQWLARNPGLTGKALADAVAQQPWDASVQAMAVLPDVVKRLSDNIQWTTDLGNAFLAQQGDVMNAVQRMRQRAQASGNLQSTPQQVVSTEVVQNENVITIEPPSPDVVYVPSYNPVAVFGEPVYPYPPIYYPSAGYYAAGAAVSWGLGVAMGAFWGSGGGWGWGPRWGYNDLTINRNNMFIRNQDIRVGNRNLSNTWQHNAIHRGGAPYRDLATANRFGGTARGDSLANRQMGARQQLSRQGGNLSNRAVGTGGVVGGAAAGSLGTRGGQLSSRNFSSDRIGQRDLSRSGVGRDAFGGGFQRYNGSSAFASSSRGASSMQSFRGNAGSFRGGGGSFRGGGGGFRGGGRGGGRR